MSRPVPFAFFPYFGMVENRPCTTRTICFWLFKLLMHKLGMFEILSRCFLESFNLQEEKTRHFIQAIRKRQPFCFMAKSAITYLRTVRKEIYNTSEEEIAHVSVSLPCLAWQSLEL